jgi:hypothetical protein
MGRYESIIDSLGYEKISRISKNILRRSDAFPFAIHDATLSVRFIPLTNSVEDRFELTWRVVLFVRYGTELIQLLRERNALYCLGEEWKAPLLWTGPIIGSHDYQVRLWHHVRC